MDLFGDYSIETASCHPSSFSRVQDDVFAPTTFPPSSPMSPRDTRTSCPSTFINVTSLSRQFSLQTLHSPSSDADTDADADVFSTVSMDSAFSTSTPLTSPTTSLRRNSITSSRSTSCWKRRSQRQREVRMLADPTHLRNIADLVERMVQNNDQCGNVGTRHADLTPTPSTPFVEDERDDYLSGSESGSPRSLSGSSAEGRQPTCFTVDHVPHRRPVESGSLTLTMGNSRIQKSRARRGPRR